MSFSFFHTTFDVLAFVGFVILVIARLWKSKYFRDQNWRPVVCVSQNAEGDVGVMLKLDYLVSADLHWDAELQKIAQAKCRRESYEPKTYLVQPVDETSVFVFSKDDPLLKLLLSRCFAEKAQYFVPSLRNRFHVSNSSCYNAACQRIFDLTFDME